MSKHDSWVYLIPNSPFEPIVESFPEGFPMRDPFPMALQQTSGGSLIPCWTLDLHRMSSTQIVLLASVFAEASNGDLEGAIARLRVKGAHLSYRWVDSLECGPEGRARTAEIREFFALYPNPQPDELLHFYEVQKQKWIEGSIRPEPELTFRALTGRRQW